MGKGEIDIAPVTSEQQDSEATLRAYDILSYPADYTLEVLVEKLKKNEINAPPLQRRFIWPIARASKLIESFLLGLPVPPVFLYQDKVNSLLIVDGKQRLLSIKYFFSGWFGEENDSEREPFKLTGLNEESQYLGIDIDQLKKPANESSYNRLKNSVMRAFIMKQLHPADDTSIIEVFERLNTGGMIAQGQEIRNCIYEGEFNELLKELNRSSHWRKIMGTNVEDRRMRDVELLLRFLALYYNIRNYKKPMKDFLNKFMKANRKPPAEAGPNASDSERRAIIAARQEYAEKMATFAKLFTETAAAVVKYLGPKPFHIKRGLNAAAFDSIFTAFALNLHMLNEKTITQRQMQAKFEKLLINTKYEARITAATTDEDVVPKRLKQAEEILFN